MKRTPKQIIQAARDFGWAGLIEENPITGNPRLMYPAVNDVSAVIELLGGVARSAEVLGVEPIEVEHWQDDHYVPNRYVAEIQKLLPGWSRWSLQTPPFDQEASVPQLLDGRNENSNRGMNWGIATHRCAET
ncbi:MAG: hypothetical protein K0S79_153 [Nitrospira sp.]|jgi:hypothetical protein|nr:hypothetical protein [Nitrospira sp.]